MNSMETFPPVSQCECFLWQINVRVTTMDAELEFAILPSTTGRQLFDQVHCAYHSLYMIQEFFLSVKLK